MVNEIVYDYLKKNYGNFDLNSLKKKIIAGGYNEEEYSDALIAIKLDNFSSPKSRGVSFMWVVFFSSFALLLFLAFLVLR